MTKKRSAITTSRRSVLKKTGIATIGAAGIGMSATPASATEEADGFEFDTVVNLVEAGADPEGQEPIDPIVEEHAESNTLLFFPPGEYRLNQFNTGFGSDMENFGFRGAGSGQVTLVPREGHGSGQFGGSYVDKLFINLWGQRNLLLEGFTIDYTAENTGGRHQIVADDGVLCRDVHVKGRTDVEIEGPSLFAVLDEDGTGVIDRLRLPDGGSDDVVGEGSGIVVWVEAKGTHVFRNCHVEGFVDNGLYGSSPSAPAKVHVEGGYYANNNISQVRLGQADSYVRNAHVEVTHVPDYFPEDRAVNMRGIWQIDGEGTLVKNCDVVMSADVASNGAITSHSRSGSLTVENSRIHVADPYQAWAILTQPTTGGDRYGNEFSGDASVSIRNVEITGDVVGSSWNSEAVWLWERDGVVENLCIEQTGDWDGIKFTDSEARLTEATIDVPGEPIVIDNSTVETRNIREEGSCQEPREGDN